MNYPTPANGHVNCKACLALNIPGCARCKRCTRCGCACQHCMNCNAIHSHKYFCRLCGRCKRPPARGGGHAAYHCTCKTRPKAQKLGGIHPLEFKGTLLRRPIGLELELSCPGNAREIQYGSPTTAAWTHDGSITPGGQELVIMPMRGEQLDTMVGYLGKAFKAYKSKVDHTCGYHVHVGAEDFGAYELRRLLVLYHRFEDLFYEIVEDGRDKPKVNPRGELKCYCARLTWRGSWYEKLMQLRKPAEIRRYLIESLYPDWVIPKRTHIDMRRVRNHKYEKCRYFGLNIHTWFERGTVEYRHHEGTMDPQKILGWAQFCGWFTEFASALNDKQLSQCHSLEHLLHTEWHTGLGVLRMPESVATYVTQAREEKAKALALQRVEKKPATVTATA